MTQDTAVPPTTTPAKAVKLRIIVEAERSGDWQPQLEISVGGEYPKIMVPLSEALNLAGDIGKVVAEWDRLRSFRAG